MDMRPRFGALVTILGHVVLTVGICLVLQPTRGDLALAALFGALVAVFKRVGGRWTSVQMIMPVAAAFAVAAITLPGGSLGWLLLVLYAAWIGQYLGGLALGGYLSGFVGAIVMTPVAYLVQRRPSGPPALVSFLPAFWLLVPGALGLIGVAEYLGQDPWRGSRTSSPPSAPWWPSALASSAAIRSTARWHGHLAGFRSSDPAEGRPDGSSVPFSSRVTFTGSTWPMPSRPGRR